MCETHHKGQYRTKVLELQDQALKYRTKVLGLRQMI